MQFTLSLIPQFPYAEMMQRCRALKGCSPIKQRNDVMCLDFCCKCHFMKVCIDFMLSSSHSRLLYFLLSIRCGSEGKYS